MGVSARASITSMGLGGSLQAEAELHTRKMRYIILSSRLFLSLFQNRFMIYELEYLIIRAAGATHTSRSDE